MKTKKIKTATYKIPHLAYYAEEIEYLVNHAYGKKKTISKDEIVDIAMHIARVVAADVHLDTRFPNHSADKHIENDTVHYTRIEG